MSPFGISDLDKIRSQIDYIDDKIHDLLMQRAEFADIIASMKGQTSDKKASPLRPAREASILKRLLVKHEGHLPIAVILHLWRSVLSAFCQMQGAFSISYALPRDRDSNIIRDIIRYYYGSTVDVTCKSTDALVMQDILHNPAVVGLFPAPLHGDRSPWWVSLYHHKGSASNQCHVIGRLPFLLGVNVQFDQNPLYAVSSCPIELSGDDLSLFVVVTSSDVSRTTVQNLLLQTGHVVQTIAVYDDMGEGNRYHLVEYSGGLTGDTWQHFAEEQKRTFLDKIQDIRLLGVLPRPVDDLDFLRLSYSPPLKEAL